MWVLDVLVRRAQHFLALKWSVRMPRVLHMRQHHPCTAVTMGPIALPLLIIAEQLIAHQPHVKQPARTHCARVCLVHSCCCQPDPFRMQLLLSGTRACGVYLYTEGAVQARSSYQRLLRTCRYFH